MKRTLAAVLALAALGASVLPWESEARDRRCRPARNGGRTGDCVSYAFFEFAPSSGAGMAGPCSTTAPTGARGEALTFARASTAYCTATASGGLATTGIANGDLVSMSNNVARAEYDSAGVLGLRVEGARTNVLLYSQQFDNVNWQTLGVGVAAPTITANAGVAPDGTTTAERVQVPAVTGGNRSIVYQATGASGTDRVFALYVKGFNNTSGVIDVWNDGSAGGAACGCAYNGTTWTRCVTGATNLGGNVGFGNEPFAAHCSGTSRNAVDVLVWQADNQPGTYVTSPILTTTAAQTRAEESGYFSTTAPTLNTLSYAATFTSNRASSETYNVLTLQDVGLTQGAGFSNGASVTFNALNFNGASYLNATTGPKGPQVAARVWGANNGSQTTGAFNGVAMTPAAGTNTVSSSNRLYVPIGGVTGRQVDGLINQICYQPDDATRCR